MSSLIERKLLFFIFILKKSGTVEKILLFEDSIKPLMIIAIFR